MPFSVPASAKWSVSENTTIAFAAMSEDPTAGANPELTPMDVSLEGVNQLSITDGYFGILDLTNYVVIRSITADLMQVDIIVHTTTDKPSMFVRTTLVPKS